LITLQQDADGFVRMTRHYPASVRIRIDFADGSTGEFSGQALNKAYDAALADFRAKNPGNRVDFVPVHPGLGE
jgi:hypothetical protein